MNVKFLGFRIETLKLPINFDFGSGDCVGQKSSQVPGGAVVVRLDVVARVDGPRDDLQLPGSAGDGQLGLPQNPGPVSRRRSGVLGPLQLGFGPGFAAVAADVHPDDGVPAAGVSVTPDGDHFASLRQRDTRPVFGLADVAGDGHALDGAKF